MFYTPQADELRAFFRDKLGIGYFDAGGGWLIFTPPSGEIGCHPAETSKQDISLYCEDIEATVADLKAKGVEFTKGIEDQGWGRLTVLRAPGGFEIQLYQPSHT